MDIWFQVIYGDLLCDRVVRLGATSKDAAIEKFNRMKHLLKNKPASWSKTNVYTTEEFDQLPVYKLFLVYQDRHQTDQSLQLNFYGKSVSEVDPAKIETNFHNVKKSLEHKPNYNTTVEIQTEQEFNQLSQYFIIYECKYGYKFCRIFCSSKEDALDIFNKRVNRESRKVLSEEEFTRVWLRYKPQIAS